MSTIEGRCMQCGSENEQPVNVQNTKHGTGREHGVERLLCPTCSGSCNLDECTHGDPCERCHTETLHNRCGSSVPFDKGRS